MASRVVSLCTFLLEYLTFPRLKQLQYLNQLIDVLYLVDTNKLKAGQSIAINSCRTTLHEFFMDDLEYLVKHQNQLQLPSRVRWILSEFENWGEKAFYRSLFTISEGGTPQSIIMCYDYEKQLGCESDHLIENLKDPEIQKRLLFGPMVIPNALKDLRVKLYSSKIGNPITSDLLHQMQVVSNSRVINRSQKKPQLGFGRNLSFEELENAATRPGAYLVVLGNGEQNFHFSLILFEEAQFCEHTKRVMQVLYNCNEVSSFDRHSWLDYIVSSMEGSTVLKTHGISAYGLSVYLTSILMAYEQSNFLYLTCRSGEWANTAINRSLSHGFDDTGIEIDSKTLTGYSQDPARVLRFDPYKLERVAHFVVKKESHDIGVFF